MYMTDEEIRKSYRQAKDPKRQLGILADLNCCSVADIKAIVNPAEQPKNLTDIEMMIQSFFEEMDRVDKEIRRLETRYTNLKGVIDALSKMVVEDAK